MVRIESVSRDPSGSIIMPRDVYDRLTDPDGPSPSPNMPSEYPTTHQYLGTKPHRHEADPKKRAAAKRARAARRRSRKESP